MTWEEIFEDQINSSFWYRYFRRLEGRDKVSRMLLRRYENDRRSSILERKTIST
jgi:hypothetical protein